MDNTKGPQHHNPNTLNIRAGKRLRDPLDYHGLPVAMERKVALSNLQLFVSFLGHAKWPQLAPKDLFWNGKMVATQHVKVLVTERRESSEVFFLWVGSGRTQVI